MFALFRLSAAGRAGAPGVVVLTAQLLGAYAANMVSVPNVVAAAAVVGLLRLSRPSWKQIRLNVDLNQPRRVPRG